MEVCNKVSEAELAHLVEVETVNQPNTTLNRQTTNPVFYNTQNQTVPTFTTSKFQFASRAK